MVLYYFLFNHKQHCITFKTLFTLAHAFPIHTRTLNPATLPCLSFPERIWKCLIPVTFLATLKLAAQSDVLSGPEMISRETRTS